MLQWCICFIISVCVYDIYVTVKTQDCLMIYEENPIAKMLLQETHIIVRMHDAGSQTFNDISVHCFADVSLLVLVKTCGLVVSLLLMQRIVHGCSLKIAAMSIVPVALVQLWLLCYLLF